MLAGRPTEPDAVFKLATECADKNFANVSRIAHAHALSYVSIWPEQIRVNTYRMYTEFIQA